MLIFAGIATVLAAMILFGPNLWIAHVLARHGVERSDLPGTGGELARHLLDEAGLFEVAVEIANEGDHYDPDAMTIRLSPKHWHGRSIAAVAVATHEVAHAVQHARGDRAFSRRLDLISGLVLWDAMAVVLMVLAPLIFLVVRAPLLFLLQIVAGLLLLSMRIVIHLVTLPVEFDASFNKALPALERGAYLSPQDLFAARQVLRAAAWTYVAEALATFLNLAQLIRVLGR